jgi:hypothetical protein
MRFLVCVLAALVFLSPGEAKAWGKYGHLTVCDIAYRNLTPASRAELNTILGSGSGGTFVRGRGKLPDRTYTSFNLGCLEEDELPRRNPDDHFINLSRNATSVVSCPASVAEGACVLEGIRRDLAILSDRSRSREDRVFALMALGHWLGDLHQPLHVSFADDRGGNGIDVRVTGGCGSSGYRARNLHAVWDNCILEAGLFERVRKRADYSRSWNRRTVTYRAVDTLMSNTSLASEIAIVAGDPQAWANEAFRITRMPEVLYCGMAAGTCRYSTGYETLPRGGTRRALVIDQAYLSRWDRTAETQIRNAGFRLAHLLNTALDPAYAGPTRNGLQPS